MHIILWRAKYYFLECEIKKMQSGNKTSKDDKGEIHAVSMSDVKKA